MIERDTLTADETPAANAHANLRLAVEAYPIWVQRVTDPNIKRSFLASCATTVPFYARLFAGRACRELEQFPIIDRSHQNTRRAEFLSRSFEDPRSDQLSIHTNGTFAPSLRVSWDLPSLFDLNHASYVRFAAVRQELLQHMLPGEPTIFVISDSPQDKRTSLVMPALDGTILRRLVLGRGEASDTAVVKCVRRSHVALLHGKPSVLAKLAELDETLGGGRIRPACFVCSGENLYPEQRRDLESWFGCASIESYVASESGLVALDCSARTGMHVLSDHLTVEILRLDGILAPSGSGDLLITNALNWRHAFIRYRIGDRATVVSGPCACGHDGQTIVHLPGRDRAGYGRFSSEAIAEAMSAHAHNVKQYQVAPALDGRGVVISWIPSRTADAEYVTYSMTKSLRERLAGLELELRRVATINVPGGKLRRFL